MNHVTQVRAKPWPTAAPAFDRPAASMNPSLRFPVADAAPHRPDVLRSELKPAIATGAIVPYYQPLIDFVDGRTVGFEVLARWNHPTRGLLLPQLFIAGAEDAGLIGVLCLGLLARALDDARGWNSSIVLSINIAPVQFCDGQLAEKILSVLAAAGFPAARLVVELTETALVADLARAKVTIAKLKRAGVRIALDDFGEGNSGLWYLRELPFDIVKIDRGFVASRRSNPKSACIVSAMIALCAALGLASVAEGVETEADADWLRAQGCTLGQGFLYSKAIPAARVAGFLSRRDAA